MSSERPELSVGAVVVHDDRLLLVRRARDPGAGRWSVPGGRVERGETMAEAVLRELAEETGLLDAVCGEALGWVERIDDTHHHVIVDFSVTLLGEPAVHAGDDAAEVAWVPLDEVAWWPGLVEGLLEFLAEHRVVPALP